MGPRKPTRTALALVVALAGIADAVAFGVWYHRSHEPGELVRRTFELKILGNGLGQKAFLRPVKIIRLRLRRIPTLGGMRVKVGGYTFEVPRGTVSIVLIAVGSRELLESGPVTYRSPAGIWRASRFVKSNGRLAPPGMVAVRVLRGHYLIPTSSASVNIPVHRSSQLDMIFIKSPQATLVMGRLGSLPRTMLWRLLTNTGWVPRGFTMKRWCAALAQCNVKPAAAGAVMSRVIDHHLAYDTDLRILRGMLRVTWGQLERQTRLSGAVWKALELQFWEVPRVGCAVWVHLPHGRTMVLYSDLCFVFDRAGRVTLEGSCRWRPNLTLSELKRVVIPFFAQAPPPGLWRVSVDGSLRRKPVVH